MVIVEKHNGPIFPKAKNLKEIEDNFPCVHHWTLDYSNCSQKLVLYG